MEEWLDRIRRERPPYHEQSGEAICIVSHRRWDILLVLDHRRCAELLLGSGRWQERWDEAANPACHRPPAPGLQKERRADGFVSDLDCCTVYVRRVRKGDGQRASHKGQAGSSPFLNVRACAGLKADDHGQ